jgi:hypothetical protein
MPKFILKKKPVLLHHAGAKEGRYCSSYSFLALALYGVSNQHHSQAALYLRGKDPLIPIG